MKRNLLPDVALILANVLWGAGFLLGKIAFQELAVSHVILIRSLIGAILLLPFVLRNRRPIQRRDLGRIVLTGFLAIPVTFLLQFNGLALTTTASAAMIMGAYPALLAFCAARFLGERIDRIIWAAIVASMVGVVLIAGTPGPGHSWLGDFLVFLCLFAAVAWVMTNQSLNERYSPLVATGYLFITGSLLLLPISLWKDGWPPLKLSPTVWAAVIASGVFASAIAFGLWNWGLKRGSMTRAGLYCNFEPLTGAVLGIMVMGDSFGPGAIAGGALILISAVAISLRAESPVEAKVVGEAA